MLTKMTANSLSRPGSAQPVTDPALSAGLCAFGGELPEPAVKVRVPDVAVAVHGHAERTRVGARKPELREDAGAQAAERGCPQLGEPHRAVGRDGEAGEARLRRRHRELGEAPV